MAESSKWEGEATVEVKNMSIEQVWAIFEDFCNIHKWIPIDTCYKVQGVDGQRGLIRYCATNVRDRNKTVVKWAREKLLVIDPIQRCMTYDIVDSNMGFKSFVATISLVPIATGGCKIRWSFVCDPIQEMTFQKLESYIQSLLNSMANKMRSRA